LSSKWPHFFGNVWSSMWIPATPARSYSSTVRRTLTGFPYPVSASQKTGTSTAPTIPRARSTISVMVVSPTSGEPWTEVETDDPLM